MVAFLTVLVKNRFLLAIMARSALSCVLFSGSVHAGADDPQGPQSAEPQQDEPVVEKANVETASEKKKERTLRLARLAAGITPSPRISPDLLKDVSEGSLRIRVSLEKRTLEVLVEDQVALICPIACGRSRMPTSTGEFQWLSTTAGSAKDHPYGSLIDGSGSLVLKGVYADYDPLPVGASFVKSPPNVTLSFSEGVIIHSGDANGTASTNGAIVIPTAPARTLARITSKGTKITIE